jgi:hypothetical protein
MKGQAAAHGATTRGSATHATRAALPEDSAPGAIRAAFPAQIANKLATSGGTRSALHLDKKELQSCIED